jgi:hypothetical protein
MTSLEGKGKLEKQAFRGEEFRTKGIRKQYPKELTLEPYRERFRIG